MHRLYITCFQRRYEGAQRRLFPERGVRVGRGMEPRELVTTLDW
jgi:hypothetical protein